MEDDDKTAENLAAALKTILSSPERKKEMSENIGHFYHPDCLETMTEEFSRLIKSAESGEPG